MLYNFADICVFPSLYEGFGFPLIEAMACGTPVICADATALPELAGDAGVLFTPGPGFAKHLAARIVGLLQDSTAYAEHSAKCLQQAARFTWARTAEETRRLYASSSLDLPHTLWLVYYEYVRFYPANRSAWVQR